MDIAKHQRTQPTNVLATDLDGTLIPLPDVQQNVTDLQTLGNRLTQGCLPLIFVTGRHLQSVLNAVRTFQLPSPNWIIADVGTSIYEMHSDKGWQLVDAYANHLHDSVRATTLSSVQERFLKFPELELQGEEKQGRFKLSYYCATATTQAVANRLQAELDTCDLPYAITSCLDPFCDRGMIDVLPRAASKAAALQWLAQFLNLEPSSIVFAGDSGNDLAALVSGFRSIVVANAEANLVASVQAAHVAAGWQDRLFIADQFATSGVLQGCRWYGLF
jgi:sucrose-6F-phosphate phosphohydrolase